jgi:RNA polymerase sigma-70 factor (ECF subfamily)
VDSLLATLPENYRRVLELRFLRGYSVRETARELGLSETNVKVLQFRALNRAGRERGRAS